MDNLKRIFVRHRPRDSASEQAASEQSGWFVVSKRAIPTELASFEDSLKPRILIVFVHGLGGHWRRSWEYEGFDWINEFLLPDLRSNSLMTEILSYGYDSRTNTSSVADVNAVAQTLLDRILSHKRNGPVIFVAHSLGGIVVKKVPNLLRRQAIILAHTNDHRFGELLRTIRGCVFLGVPHRGADNLWWKKTAKYIIEASTIGARGNSNFIRSIERNSGIWRDIAASFKPRARELVIHSFFETKRTGPVVMVDKDSALIGLTQEVEHPADSNHVNISKFGKDEKLRYQLVGDAIIELVKESVGNPALSTSENETFKRPEPMMEWCYPTNIPQNNYFVPRADLLARIADTLSRKPHICVLQGMGGLGKTEMARSIVRSLKDRCHVFWIDCKSRDAMIRDTTAIATDLAPGAVLTGAINKLLAKRKDWFIVIDNVDDEDKVDYIKNNIIPSDKQGKLLITGRLTGLSRIYRSLDMPEMTVIEATTLLQGYLCEVNNQQKAEQLVELLGRLPLAVEQAGLYIRNTRKSIQEFIDLYKEDDMRATLLNYQPADPGSEPVLRTFDISFKKVTEENPDTQRLLYMIAFLRTDGTSHEFLKRSGEHHPVGHWPLTDQLTEFDRGIHLPDAYRELLTTVCRRETAADALVEISLAKRNDERLNVHPLQREWLRKTCPITPVIRHVVVAMIVNYLASMIDREFVLRSGYIHYVDICVEMFADPSYNGFNHDDASMAKIYFYLGRVYWLMGEDTIAAYFYMRTVDRSMKAFNTYNFWTIWSHTNLGQLFEAHGDYGEALYHLGLALTGMSHIFPEENSDMEAVQNFLDGAERAILEERKSKPKRNARSIKLSLAKIEGFGRPEFVQYLHSSIERYFAQASPSTPQQPQHWDIGTIQKPLDGAERAIVEERKSKPKRNGRSNMSLLLQHLRTGIERYFTKASPRSPLLSHSDPTEALRTPSFVCQICDGEPSKLRKALQQMLFDSEIHVTKPKLGEDDVHLQASMQVLLNDMWGAYRLYQRALVTVEKSLRFDTTTLQLCVKIFEQLLLEHKDHQFSPEYLRYDITGDLNHIPGVTYSLHVLLESRLSKSIYYDVVADHRSKSFVQMNDENKFCYCLTQLGEHLRLQHGRHAHLLRQQHLERTFLIFLFVLGNVLIGENHVALQFFKEELSL